MSRSDTVKLTRDMVRLDSNAKTATGSSDDMWFTWCTCHDQIDTCELDRLERVSNNPYDDSRENLEAELNDRTKHEEQNDALLGALSTTADNDSYNLVVDGLLDKSKTRQEIFNLLMAERKASASHPEAEPGQACSVSKGTSGAENNIGRSPGVCRHCNKQGCVIRTAKLTKDVTEIEGSELHHSNIPKLSLATKTKTSTEPKSKALLDPATVSSSQAVGCDTESWDQAVTDLISFPSTTAAEETSSPKHSRGTTPECLPPSVLMQGSDAAADSPDMSTQLVERSASPDERSATSMQRIESALRDKEHGHRHCDNVIFGASNGGSEAAWSDLGDGSRSSSPAMAESPCTPPPGPAIDFASYALDGLFVLDAMEATMAHDGDDCDTPLPTSLNAPHSGLSLSTLIIAPAIVDEERNGVSSELPQALPVCVLRGEPKRPDIKLRLQPTSGRVPCSATNRPQTVLSVSTATALHESELS
ncbi:hypothetical protein Purlil1_13239 [Purpureocillium lilacinum]|uniref:Uncharacterized protein n=1 Tax=Purpureocillium lilacinum TaxID=33203 RepID=A0ABR0BEP7_PURLI|nr:hypothetical protein Purlil1_13239 [Purpureocillium lilacinum]